MRRLLAMACVVLLMGTTQARDQWTLDGRAYDVDTMVYPHPVGPGVVFAKYDLPAMPLKVSVMTLDLTNPYIELEAWLGNSRSVGTETPAHVAQRMREQGRQVVGVTNGDFYRTAPTDQVGVPTSGQITQGQVMVAPTARASFAIDDNHKPYIDRIDFRATYVHAGQTTTIGKMNNPENTGENRTILFTNAYGPVTYTCSSGKLVLLAPRDTPFAWRYTGTEHCVVQQVIDATGTAITIPQGKAYLWMQGTHVARATAMAVGDLVDIHFSTTLRQLPGAEVPIKEMVGGSDHLFLRDGQFLEDWAERHPRTCVGFSADSTRVFFVVIDGRWTESLGVTLKEAAGIFQALGAAHAVNLDGGGSSCMVVGDEVVNHPSDGTVRAVGNGLVIFATSPPDDDIGMLHFEPRSYNLSRSAMLLFKVWGYNRYGVLKQRDVQGCRFWCDPQLGHFDEQGTFFAADTLATGMIYAALADTVIASQRVTLVEADVALRCDSVVIDRCHPYAIELMGTSGYNTDRVDPRLMRWSVADPAVCSVDSQGVLQALADGRTEVYGTIGSVTDTLVVRVENPRDTVTTVENAPIEPDTWTITQSGGNNRVVTPLDNGMRIAFTGASSRNPYIKLAKRLTMWGLPTALRLRLRPGDLQLTRLTISTALNVGAQIITAIDIPHPAPDEITLSLPTDQWCDAADLGTYPLQLVYLQLSMSSPTAGQTYQLDIPGIELLYQSCSKPLTADVDDNGVVDIADVNIIVNVALGMATHPRADINGSGQVDVSDINMAINAMLFQKII